MANNLSAHTSRSSDRRPHQTGKAEGSKSGAPVSASTEWMIDTGAQVSCITKKNANQFDLTVVGGSASGTTGGGGILMKSGLTTEFEIIGLSGSPKTVSCSLKIGVKPNNSGSEILGIDRLNHVSAAVTWDPVNLTGSLDEV